MEERGPPAPHQARKRRREWEDEREARNRRADSLTRLELALLRDEAEERARAQGSRKASR